MLDAILIFLVIVVILVVCNNCRFNSYRDYSLLKPVQQILPATKEQCILMKSTYNVNSSSDPNFQDLPYDKKLQWSLGNCNSLLNAFELLGRFKLSGTAIFEKYPNSSVFITIDQNGVSVDNVPPCKFDYHENTGNIINFPLSDFSKKSYGKVIDKDSFFIELNNSSILYSRIL